MRAGFAGSKSGAAVLFVAFLVAIFCGFFYHIAQLVFGPPADAPRGDSSRWKTYPVIGLAAVVVLLGFWMPGPLYALVDQAARILVVHP